MSKNISVKFNVQLQESKFIERTNRFILKCEINSKSLDNGMDHNIVEAHLGDTGRLKEILIPGCKVWLKPADNPNRKTKWTAVLCKTSDNGSLISLVSTLPNKLINKALRENALEEFEGWKFLKSEYKMGNSRFDFLLENNQGKKMLLEVKSVTHIVKDGLGLFPDAVTARGARHVRELREIAKENEDIETAILFVAQREDVEVIKANRDIDPNFADEIEKAKKDGVKIFGRKCHIDLEKIVLGDRVVVK